MKEVLPSWKMTLSKSSPRGGIDENKKIKSNDSIGNQAGNYPFIFSYFHS